METKKISKEDVEKVMLIAEVLNESGFLSDIDKEKLIRVGISAVTECNNNPGLNKNEKIVSNMGECVKNILSSKPKKNGTKLNAQYSNIGNNVGHSLNNLFYNDSKPFSAISLGEFVNPEDILGSYMDLSSDPSIEKSK